MDELDECMKKAKEILDELKQAYRDYLSEFKEESECISVQ